MTKSGVITCSLAYNAWDDIPPRLREGFVKAMGPYGGRPEKIPKGHVRTFTLRYDIDTHMQLDYTESEDGRGFVLEKSSRSSGH